MLGLNLHVSGWCVDCRLRLQEVEAALVHLVEQIKMDTGGLPCWIQAYPLEGKGGTGVTAVQPLVESFALGCQPAGAVIGDTWTDHHHAFFVIASCRPYDKRAVGEWLHAHLGKIIDFGEISLKGGGGGQ